MDKIKKFKSLVSIMLLVAMMFSPSVSAAAPILGPLPPAQHNEFIYRFISEIQDAQTQSAVIAQSAYGNSILEASQLQMQIDTISNNLYLLSEEMEDYADLVQGLNEQDRQVRLTFNVLNLVRSNLYTLTLLLRARTDIERIRLLDEYFRTRINATNTLEMLNAILTKYNP